MKRLAFYITVALLTFGVSYFVAINLCWKTVNKSEIFQDEKIEKISNISIKPKEAQNTSQKTFDVVSKGKFTCKDKTLKLVWNQLKGTVIEAIYGNESEAIGDCTDFFRVEKFYDLNEDKKKEMFIRTKGTWSCGGVGNCDLYIFTKKGNAYKLILNAYMTQRFEVKKNKSNGYFDIETSAHGSATSGSVGIYKFSGKEYKVRKCFNYDYIDQNNNGKELDEPILTKTSCQMYGD